jgi:kynurenine formamidase
MRDVPDPPLRPWDPPSYRVDSEGKVVDAAPGTPNNWGRWGDDDQRGTFNLFTPERIAAAAALIRTGKRFSLGLPVGGPPMPGYRSPPLHFFNATTGDIVLGERGIQYSDDYVVMALQATTQLDGLAHVGADDLLYNGFWAGLVTARSGARRLGVHHQADGIVGRAVVLDVARHVGTEPLEMGFAIGPDLLDETAAAQGVSVGAGDVLLVRTGLLGWLLEGNSVHRTEPGLSPRCAPWLAEHDIAMVATDTLGVEVLPPEEGQPPLGLHVSALRDLGLLLGELLDLDELAADCAADGVYECFFVAAPMPVVNGVGSPINPIAIK